MKTTRVIFFGSTDDSVIVLNKLYQSTIQQFNYINIICAVTQPARPRGRSRTPTPTPVYQWAKVNKIPVLYFESDKEKPWLYKNEQEVIQTLLPLNADLLLTVCYGQKIPSETIRSARYGGLNIHPSILPRWRGGDPVPWTILAGDRQTGVTIVTLAEKFDEGKIIAQKKIPLQNYALPDPLRTELFSNGADLLTSILATFKGGTFKGQSFNRSVQIPKKASYARRFNREDGYLPWEILEQTINVKPLTIQQCKNLTVVNTLHKYLSRTELTLPASIFIDRMVRALTPWPGVWTIIAANSRQLSAVSKNRRLKILKTHLDMQMLVLDLVQLEGKKPVSAKQFYNAYQHLFINQNS